MRKLLAILLLLFTLSSLLQAEKPMKLVYFSDYQPLSWKAADGKMKGILIDVLTEAIENRMQIPITHQGFPWARAQYMVKTGTADAFTSIPTPTRKKYTIISEQSVIEQPIVIFVNKDNVNIEELKKINNSSELRKYTQIQYLGNGWAKENLQGLNIFWVRSLHQVLKDLAGGGRSVFASGALVTEYNIKKLGYKSEIIKLPNPMDLSYFHLCIGKKSPYKNIINKFNETIKKMKKDGTLIKIYDKYR